MQAEITYTRDTGDKLVNETFGPNNIRRRTSGAEEPHRVEIADGRRAGDLSIDQNGFVLVDHRTQVRDFFDADELKRVYYPEVVALVQRVSGAKPGVGGRVSRVYREQRAWCFSPPPGAGARGASGRQGWFGSRCCRRTTTTPS